MLLAIAAVLLLVVCYSVLSGSAPRRFDRALWLAADPSTRTRAEMVADLLERQPLRRLNRLQVVGLLGPPTPTDKWGDRDLAYVLGPRSGWLGTDHEWLLIDFDDRGGATRHEITTD